MERLKWEYLTTLDELRACLKKDTFLHGGGTGILRNVPREARVADLSGLELSSVRVEDGRALIGGTASYGETARVIGERQPGHIMEKTLIDTASPALRNRITVGGSIALFPPWGRVVGPLVALEATLTIVGRTEGTFPVSEYIDSSDLGEQTAITEVQVDIARRWNSYFYRFSPTKLAYPLFSLVVLTDSANDGTISDSRIVISGVRGRYKRLTELEQAVRGSDPGHVEITDEILGVAFPDRQGFSGEYLAHLAAVEIARGLRSAEGDAK